MGKLSDEQYREKAARLQGQGGSVQVADGAYGDRRHAHGAYVQWWVFVPDDPEGDGEGDSEKAADEAEGAQPTEDAAGYIRHGHEDEDVDALWLVECVDFAIDHGAHESRQRCHMDA